MTRTEIFTKLKEIFDLVVHNGVNTDHIDEDSKIVTDLGVNSVGLIYLAIAIEKEFGIDMKTISTADFSTIGDIITLIEKSTK